MAPKTRLLVNRPPAFDRLTPAQSRKRGWYARTLPRCWRYRHASMTPTSSSGRAAVSKTLLINIGPEWATVAPTEDGEDQYLGCQLGVGATTRARLPQRRSTLNAKMLPRW